MLVESVMQCNGLDRVDGASSTIRLLERENRFVTCDRPVEYGFGKFMERCATKLSFWLGPCTGGGGAARLEMSHGN